MSQSQALPAVADAVDDSAAVAATVGASGSSFYLAMRLLPQAKRDAMFAIYAFCREVDDIADEPAPQEQKYLELGLWREEIARLYDGRQPTKPVGRALAASIAQFHMQKADFLAVIDGMAMDAERDIRAPSLDELRLYCDRVASAVGRLSVRAFGDWKPRADDVADHLGQALQLTNILRDIDEDAERGRLYLPGDLLVRHGITSIDPMTVINDPRVDAVCRELAVEAARRFVEADRAIADCDRRIMRPAVMMSAVYHETLKRVLVRGWAPPRAELKIPKLTKVWLALKAGYLTR
jgi:presqualene diphosphate synthase